MNGPLKKDTVYQDLSKNMRLYADLRFKQLSLFFVLTGALFIAYFRKTKIDCLPENTILIAIPIMGIIAAIIFWVMEERAADYYWTLRDYAKKLEGNSKGQYHSLKPVKYKNATNATRLIYSLTIIIWTLIDVCHIYNRTFLKVIIVVISAVCVLGVFSKRIMDCKKNV